MSLRRQFVVVFVAFSVCLTAVGGWVAWRETSRTLERELDEKLRWVAGAAAEVGFDPDFLRSFQPGSEYTRDWNTQYERLKGLQRWVSAAYLFDRQSRALVTTAGPDSLPVGTRIFFLDLYPEELEQAWVEGDASTPLFPGLDGRYYKYGLVRVAGSDVMLAVLMRTDYLEPLDMLRQRILFGSVLAALVAAAVAGILATTVVEPLERLSRVALRIQRGRLTEPVQEERGDELGRLARAMERMRVGVIQRDEQLRLMLAQVAHEIRNPLGGLELFASAAMDSEDAEERTRLLGRVRYEVEALNQIINDFLTFARPMEAQSQLHDIRLPLRQAADLVQVELTRKGGRLVVDLPEEELLARADPDHLKRIVLNLLRNAADVAGRIDLVGRLNRGEVEIVVMDDGPGIPEGQRERIFEPFRDRQGEGSGCRARHRQAAGGGERRAGRTVDQRPGEWGRRPVPPIFPGVGGPSRAGAGGLGLKRLGRASLPSPSGAAVAGPHPPRGGGGAWHRS